MNQQQLPSKLKDIRQMFTAGKGRVLIGCDFSKQEPCVLASASKDPDLIQVFLSGVDIYSKIASMMYNVPYEDCLEHCPDGTTNKEGKERRSHAKKVVLSIMYSKGAKTLADDLHSTPEKAQQIMDATLKAFPVMGKWMEETVKKAKKQGYIEHIFGRRRRWPEFSLPDYSITFPKGTDEKTKEYYTGVYINRLSRARFKNDKDKIIYEARSKGINISSNEALKAKATREIINFNIQGAASVITLRAMRNIYNNKRLQELGCKLLMSIHDKPKTCRV